MLFDANDGGINGEGKWRVGDRVDEFLAASKAAWCSAVQLSGAFFFFPASMLESGAQMLAMWGTNR